MNTQQDMTTITTTTAAAFERARTAEPALVHLNAMVTAFERLAPSKRSGTPMCYDATPRRSHCVSAAQ